MGSIWPVRVRSIAVTCATICAVSASSLIAQPYNSPSQPVEQPNPVLANDIANRETFFTQAPSNTVLNDEAIRRIVRDELHAGRVLNENAPIPYVEPQWVPPEDDRALISRWDNGFVSETRDKTFRIHVGGRLEFDNSWFGQDDNILIGPSADHDMRDGTLFRRARFRADGRSSRNW